MKTNVNKVHDALIVGAGPAGIGCALALDAVEDLRFGVVDRGAIGQTFLDWPVKQKLLTPSFTSNGYGSPDLNSIHPDTSPAYSFNSDYLTGRQYADYLRGVVKSFPLPVLEHTEVTSVVHDGEVFMTETDKGPVVSHTIIWAGGEFHDRPVPDLPGAEFLDHSASEQAWACHDGPVVIIGGYESGIDLACHHIADGADVTVVDGNKPWDAGSISDPSIRLAPRSLVRLREAQATGRLTLIGSPACSVTRDGDSFLVLLENGQRIATPERAIAATGFGPGLGPVRELFEQRADGWPLLDENDCSTLIPGLFLSGPAVRHGGLRFCFIYKYRQRFAHIARVIGESRGQDCHNLDFWRDEGMLIDDLSCCGTDCTC